MGLLALTILKGLHYRTALKVQEDNTFRETQLARIELEKLQIEKSIQTLSM